MPNPLFRAAAPAAALLASLAVPAAAGTAPPAPASIASAPLTLINGDRLLVQPGPRTAAVQPQKGLGGIVFPFVGCGQSMHVPAVALPYLGRGLDPSLFELTALERAERNGRLPVHVSFHGRVPPLPGVRITRSGRGLAEGYLTPASAARFGAALNRQFLADHARGSYGRDGLFAGGVSIALPGPPATGPARPSFPMHTLTVTGTSLAGKPDTGDDVLVFNADNCARLGAASAASTFYRGVAKYSVPAGHYWAVGQFFSFSKNGPAIRLAILPQFSVHRGTTVSVSARSATSKITMTTPRRTTMQSTAFSLVRTSPRSVLSAGWFSVGYSIWVSPVRKAPGTLRAYTSGQLTSPPGAGVPYAYTLNFAAPPGIIPPQHHVVRQADLATISERYYQDLGSAGAWVTAGGSARQIAQGASGAFDLPLRLPTRQVQYLSARPATFWRTQYWESGRVLGGGQTAAFRLLHAGEHLTGSWNRYPLHPGVDTIFRGTGALPAALLPALPSAARAGNTLRLAITPFSDNQAGHRGTGFSTGMFGSLGPVSGGYALYQNGVKIASGGAVTGAQILLVRATLNSSPSLQVSFNDGRTWRQARVRRTGAGRFRATFTAPRSQAVALRVTTRDASDASLTETIRRAYHTSA